MSTAEAAGAAESDDGREYLGSIGAHTNVYRRRVEAPDGHVYILDECEDCGETEFQNKLGPTCSS